MLGRLEKWRSSSRQWNAVPDLSRGHGECTTASSLVHVSVRSVLAMLLHKVTLWSQIFLAVLKLDGRGCRVKGNGRCVALCAQTKGV